MSTITEPTIEFLDRPMRLYIDGAFVETEGSMAIVNPATGRTLADVPLATEREVDLAVDAAGRAFETWRFTPPTERARLIWSLADLLEAHKDEFAQIEVLDNGKPLWEAQLVDIALTIELLRYYAGWTTKITGDVMPNSIPGMLTISKREPVGVVAAITPWNFPILEVAYKLGPALATGCTVVVKPSELAPLSTLRLMDLIDEAGFPPGVVNVVIGGPEVGGALVRHPGVHKIAFTGQTNTGKEIMRASIDGLKRVTLELGGKSPNIVFADADLDAAASGAFGGVFFNQGQACVAGSRLFVEAPVAEELVARVSEQANGVRLGSRSGPADADGTADLREAPRPGARLRRVRDRGGRRGHGGRRGGLRGGPGGRLLPAAHGDQRRAQRHEGGAGGDLRARAVGDPVEGRGRAAARSPTTSTTGLPAGIWTSDTSKALRAGRRLEAGTVWINTYGMFDVAVPFGGRKHSGFGRELGAEALEPYLQSKSVWVDLTSAVPQAGQGIGR